MSDQAILDAALGGRVLWLKHELAAIGTPYAPGLHPLEQAAHHRRYRAAVDKLNHDLLSLPYQPAGIRHTNNTVQMSMLGIKVSCTAGLVGACQNWINRAEEVLA